MNEQLGKIITELDIHLNDEIVKNLFVFGDVTSTLTLSVSSSTITSSIVTESPTFLSHLATVASATDSPKVGTITGVFIR